MNISVFGAGYVGLVSAVCLAKLGHEVICVDINSDRIARLAAGECVIHEDGLSELLTAELASGRLQFTTDLSVIKTAKLHMIATGTPSLPNGDADLSQVFAAADSIAEHVEEDSIVIIKSTVPPGTGDALNKQFHLTFVSNPEFLREGRAVVDFLQADRIIVGGEKPACEILNELYQPLIAAGIPFVAMSRASAELSKYAANAMLACRISFMNQISQIAEKLTANVEEVKHGMGLDPRIGQYFLDAGIGYGGSCFPKDVRALEQTTKQLGLSADLFTAIDAINETQKHWAVQQLLKHFENSLSGRTIGLWGLAFKPGTDDLREASSLIIINSLLAHGVKLRVYDPAALSNAQKIFSHTNNIIWCDSAEAVLANLDALVIVTEWDEFRQYPLDKLSHKLHNAPVFDGRNCFQLSTVQTANLNYYSVGRPQIVRTRIVDEVC